jgi:hypothetical protein
LRKKILLVLLLFPPPALVPLFLPLVAVAIVVCFYHLRKCHLLLWLFLISCPFFFAPHFGCLRTQIVFCLFFAVCSPSVTLTDCMRS